MSWGLEYSKKALKQLDKLDKKTRREIVSWMRDNVKGCENPRAHGHVLHGKEREHWVYKPGDYRVVCDIQYDRLVVLAIRVEHRSVVYTQMRHK